MKTPPLEVKYLWQLDGWEIVELERYKQGVVRVYAEKDTIKGRERVICFARDELFQALQLPKN